MRNQWILQCVVVAMCAAYAMGLECYVCKDKEEDNACGKMGEEFNAAEIKTEICEETRNVTASERYVCGKTITTYQSVSNPENKGIIASRYCDTTSEEDDECEEDTSSGTTTVNCICSTELCNAGTRTTSAIGAVLALLSAVAAAAHWI